MFLIAKIDSFAFAGAKTVERIMFLIAFYFILF